MPVDEQTSIRFKGGYCTVLYYTMLYYTVLCSAVVWCGEEKRRLVLYVQGQKGIYVVESRHVGEWE